MRCSNCGFDNQVGYKFCGRCGNVLQQGSPKTLSLRCQDCGGVMSFDENRSIMFCPYCGSKNLVEESDTVKVEKIRSKTELGKEQILADRLLEEKKMNFEHDKLQVKIGLILLLISLGIFLVMGIIALITT